MAKTPHGKERSRMNAFKHGLRATDDLFLAHLQLRESIIPHWDRFSRHDWRSERQLRILHNRLRSLYISRGDMSLNFLAVKE